MVLQALNHPDSPDSIILKYSEKCMLSTVPEADDFLEESARYL